MSRSANGRSQSLGFRLGIEALEGRAVPSVVTAAGITAARALSARPADQAVSTFSVDNVTVLYTPSGLRLAVITVTRSGSTDQDASVNYSTLNGSAKAHRDYTPAHGTLEFSAGHASETIPVTVAQAPPPPVHPNGLHAPNTAFFLDLSKPSANAALGSHSEAYIAIHNSARADRRPTIKPIGVVKDKKVNMEQFFDWQVYENAFDRPNIATVPLHKRVPSATDAQGNRTSPPVVVGFDMGDWQYDPFFTEWSQGGSGTQTLPSLHGDDYRTAADVYNFSFWNWIDISYYTGHNFLTIPPTVWTDAAHANGVLSLSMLNLNDDGASHPNLLNTPEKVERVASTAVAIAKFYGFDGYLINNETYKRDDGEGAPTGAETMSLMNALRAAGLTVIWYDSPVSGVKSKLPGMQDTYTYANYLNTGALPFLNAAGDFQSNYDWPTTDTSSTHEANPKLSYETLYDDLKQKYGEKQAEKLALMERDHVFSALYLGNSTREANDSVPGVWGTEFFDDYLGILQTSSKVSPPHYYTGLGIYGPDLTLLCCNLQNDRQTLPSTMQFQRIDQAFWTGTGWDASKIETKPIYEPKQLDRIPQNEAWKSLAVTIGTPRSVVNSTPFVTDFNTGEGTFYNWLGAPVAKNAWNNLTNQSILPTNLAAVSQSGAPQTVAEYQYDDAYIGGSCLNIYSPSVAPSAQVTYQLYNTNLIGSTLTNVTFTVKPSDNSAYFLPQMNVDVWTGASQQPTSLSCTQDGEPKNGWITFQAIVPASLAGQTITGVGLTLTNSGSKAQQLNLYIGQMQLSNQAHQPGQPQIFHFQPQHGGILNWHYYNGYTSSSTYNAASTYNIYGYLAGKYYLLGTTRGFSYNTQGIILNRSLNGFTQFAVQEVNAAGDFQPLPGQS
jgi:endo-beta-N-acetylglucosaminidase D